MLFNKEVLGFWDELRRSRRLQFGLLCIFIVLVLEVSISTAEYIKSKTVELQKIRNDLASLKSQAKEEKKLREFLSLAERQKENLERKVWLVPSDGVGQAMLREWLTGVAAEIGAVNPSFALSDPIELRARIPKDEHTGIDPGGSYTGDNPLKELREFVVAIGFNFSPEVLEMFLARLEGDDIFSVVQALSVKKRERRVEMSVRVIMRVSPMVERSEKVGKE